MFYLFLKFIYYKFRKNGLGLESVKIELFLRTSMVSFIHKLIQN